MFRQQSYCNPLLFSLLLIFVQTNNVQCIPNKRFHISTICSNEKFSSSLPKLIDGAVITSNREENLNCVITFTTESVLQKFMLRFEELKLDCNDHLYIYDGDIAVGNPKADLSCRSTRNEVGTIFINGYFVTLKYVTDSSSKLGDGFSLVITSYKDTSPQNCNLFTCANQFCISPELTCDNVNHCGDSSDESNEAAYAQCPVPESDSAVIFGLEASAFLGLVFILFLVCLLCVVSVALCLFRSDNGYRTTQQSRINLLQGTPILTHPSYANTIVANASQRFATLPLEKNMREKPPPYVMGTNPALCNISMSTLNNMNAQNNMIPVQHVVYYTGK